MTRIWTHSPFEAQALAALPPATEVVTGAKPRSDAWFAMASGCDAMIIGGQTIIDGPALDRIGPRLRAVARTGIGYDAIDVPAATERGVMVINTPDGPTESTAEHAIALILNLAKGVAIADRVLRSGVGFPPYGALAPGLELRGATLGLVGLGRIGGRVAEIARVLGMRVLAFDPYANPERAAALGVTLTASLAELLGAAHVVSVHCPAMPETYRLINEHTLALMRPGSYLINVARGSIVDEAALVAALQSGHLAGAGIDVYDPEPTVADHPLYGLPNTICTPHIASYTSACVVLMQIQACEQVAMALAGQRPNHLVNPDVWQR
ncbi:MAG: hydroxyacid dehydrogenase [Roseiflexaceae bacterium]|nr:hydroxyacid dehydrogenase [Roseiflexaceae bacterium]